MFISIRGSATSLLQACSAGFWRLGRIRLHLLLLLFEGTAWLLWGAIAPSSVPSILH